MAWVNLLQDFLTIKRISSVLPLHRRGNPLQCPEWSCSRTHRSILLKSTALPHTCSHPVDFQWRCLALELSRHLRMDTRHSQSEHKRMGVQCHDNPKFFGRSLLWRFALADMSVTRTRKEWAMRHFDLWSATKWPSLLLLKLFIAAAIFAATSGLCGSGIQLGQV